MTITIVPMFALGLWGIMWALERLLEVKHPIWSGVMIILALVFGVAFVFTGAGILR